MGKVFIEVEDKKGFRERYAARTEELGFFYGTYPMPDIENIERFNAIIDGTKRPRRTELEAIAEALEVSVDWLLFGIGEPKEPGES